MPGIAKSTTNETTFTLHQPPYTYLQLQLTSLPPKSASSSKSKTQPTLDPISLRQYLTAALAQSFGITGSAIAIDILKVEGRDGWVRVQTEDREMLVAGLSQWSSASQGVALRIVQRGCWLGGLGKGKEKPDVLWSLEK